MAINYTVPALYEMFIDVTYTAPVPKVEIRVPESVLDSRQTAQGMFAVKHHTHTLCTQTHRPNEELKI